MRWRDRPTRFAPPPSNADEPIERLRVAIQLLFESSRPDPTARRPLFTDFAPRLLVSHPSEVKIAHAPLLALLTELMEEAERRRSAA